MVNLTERLKTVASFVNNGAFVADIGTDHAKLPIYLLQAGIAERVIATDINKKPLEKASERINKHNAKVELRLCGGISGISAGEIDTVIIAGMGGETIAEILYNDIEKLENINIILQPMTAQRELREFLYNNLFCIKHEKVVAEKEKIYTIINVCLQDKKDIINPKTHFFTSTQMLDNEPALLKRYIEIQLKRIKNELKGTPFSSEEFKVLTDSAEYLHGML